MSGGKLKDSSSISLKVNFYHSEIFYKLNLVHLDEMLLPISPLFVDNRF